MAVDEIRKAALTADGIKDAMARGVREYLDLDPVPDYASEMAKAILDEDWAKAQELAMYYQKLKTRLADLEALLRDLHRDIRQTALPPGTPQDPRVEYDTVSCRGGPKE